MRNADLIRRWTGRREACSIADWLMSLELGTDWRMSPSRLRYAAIANSGGPDGSDRDGNQLVGFLFELLRSGPERHRAFASLDHCPAKRKRASGRRRFSPLSAHGLTHCIAILPWSPADRHRSLGYIPCATNYRPACQARLARRIRCELGIVEAEAARSTLSWLEMIEGRTPSSRSLHFSSVYRDLPHSPPVQSPANLQRPHPVDYAIAALQFPRPQQQLPSLHPAIQPPIRLHPSERLATAAHDFKIRQSSLFEAVRTQTSPSSFAFSTAAWRPLTPSFW